MNPHDSRDRPADQPPSRRQIPADESRAVASSQAPEHAVAADGVDDTRPLDVTPVDDDAGTTSMEAAALARRKRRERRRAAQGRGRSPLRGCLGMGAAVLLAALVTMGLIYGSDRITRGVRVLDVPLGGLTTAEAARVIEPEWPKLMIMLATGDETWEIRATDLGLVLDAAATAELARERGRSPRDVLGALVSDRSIDVEPVWHLDERTARDLLTDLEHLVYVDPASAELQITDAIAMALPPRDGRALDVESSVARLLLDAAATFDTGRLELVTDDVPPVTGDVSAAVAQANRRLADPVVVRFYDPVRDDAQEWSVHPHTWSSWVSGDVVVGPTPRLRWTTHADRVLAALEEAPELIGEGRYVDEDEAVLAIADAVDTGARAELRVFHEDSRHTVKRGESLSSIAEDYGVPFPWIQQANQGIGDAVWPGQVVIVPSPDNLLPLPVVEGKRVVVDISAQRMWAYEDGIVKWDWPVSTGIAESPTAPGVFQVQSHEEMAYASNWDLDMPNFLGIYRPVPTHGFMNGFHGYPKRGGTDLLWRGSLGHPVTYGCILVDSANAAELYQWAEEGVVVEVRN